MKNIFEIFRKNDIGEPPWDYNFLVNLDEREYPKYLAKVFNYRTGEKLPLCRELRIDNGELKIDYKIDKKRCKTFNQKIQWIKLYSVTDLMRQCTDKVAVRDYVKERIGEEYLKPVLQICDNFDKIDFRSLPKAFVLKCNHGSKWQYIIKDKEDVLNTKPVVDLMRRNMTGWLEQEFFPWEGFEMQYKGIESKIIVEPLLREDINQPVREIEVYCFNGKPRIFVNVKYDNQREISYYDENFNQIDLILHPDGNNIVIHEKADDYINQTFDLSIKLSKDFNFVRVDWFVFNSKLYFNELTFSPYSGLIEFDKTWNLKLGNWLKIGGNCEFK